MNSVPVSVIIPAYNQAEFLAKTIQSVLDQTYQNFEILVVNDASTDDTDRVIEQFNDPRLTYIVHQENLRLSATRNTGMKTAKGEIIFLLDADDQFHPDKLQAHVDFLDMHPEIGVSYNARFELNHSAESIREMWRPPLTVGLTDLILGFPFAPSDMVIRKEWIEKVGMFDPDIRTAEDTDFPCRLALAGCKFAGIDRALNYRRYHSGRGRKSLSGRLDDVKRAQAAVFSDPRCPGEVLTIQETAIRHHLMVIVSLALIQGETELAQQSIRELVQLDPSVIEGNPCELVDFLMTESIADENLDHEPLLRDMFAQLPDDSAWLANQFDWAVARGHLWKGIRAIIWDRPEDGKIHFARAAASHARFDESILQLTTYHLLGYENEFGPDAVDNVLANLVTHLDQIGKQQSGKKLTGSYLVNRALKKYHAGEFKRVPIEILRAWQNDPAYLTNRGALSIFLRSIVKAVR